jgi:hypothetical protein
METAHRTQANWGRNVPKMPAPDLIWGGSRFSEWMCGIEEAGAQD